MLSIAPPCPENQYHEAHVRLLLDSYERLLNRPLLESAPNEDLGRRAFEADFVLLSHTADQDPLFNYGNRLALALFEFSWDELVGMPSRLSAEPVNREERERLLATVTARDYIDDYAGVRIAASGKRFMIRQAVVWNVYGQEHEFYGQAACFKDWQLLSGI